MTQLWAITKSTRNANGSNDVWRLVVLVTAKDLAKDDTYSIHFRYELTNNFADLAEKICYKRPIVNSWHYRKVH